jgi:hypothetical protein
MGCCRSEEEIGNEVGFWVWRRAKEEKWTGRNKIKRGRFGVIVSMEQVKKVFL